MSSQTYIERKEKQFTESYVCSHNIFCAVWHAFCTCGLRTKGSKCKVNQVTPLLVPDGSTCECYNCGRSSLLVCTLWGSAVYLGCYFSTMCTAGLQPFLNEQRIEKLLVDFLTSGSDSVKVYACQAFALLTTFPPSKELFRDLGTVLYSYQIDHWHPRVHIWLLSSIQVAYRLWFGYWRVSVQRS